MMSHLDICGSGPPPHTVVGEGALSQGAPNCLFQPLSLPTMGGRRGGWHKESCMFLPNLSCALLPCIRREEGRREGSHLNHKQIFISTNIQQHRLPNKQWLKCLDVTILNHAQQTSSSIREGQCNSSSHMEPEKVPRKAGEQERRRQL